MPEDSRVGSPSAAVGSALDVRGRLLDGAERRAVEPDAIDGRILASDVVAGTDVPPVSRATMDGYAVRAGGGRRRVVGESRPEDDDVPTLRSGEAVHVTTGAPLPDGTDVVVERERATRDGDTVTVPTVESGRNVYPAGVTTRAGDVVLAAGTRLGADDAPLLADLGVETVPVRERFDVRLVATGSEIATGAQPDRDSAMLAGLARAWGHRATVADPVPDDAAAVRSALDAAAHEADVVLTTGGTAGGAADHVRSALDDLGDVVVDGLAVRPGRHTALAVTRNPTAAVVSLPGKPVAAYLGAVRLARPLLTGVSAWPTTDATLACDLSIPDGDDAFLVPVELDGGTATPLGHAASSLSLYGATFDPRVLADCTRALRADGYVETGTSRPAGETVAVVPTEALA